MKVFNMNGCEWIAAETIEEAIQFAADDWAGGSLMKLITDGLIQDPMPVGTSFMHSLKHTGEDGREDPVSFKEALGKMVQEGQKFPCHFASTEF